MNAFRKLREGIDAQRVPFPVRFDNTFAFVYIDGVTACESFVLKALYDSEFLPCPYIGGSASGALDFSHTYIYNGKQVLENHAVVLVVRLADDYRYSISSHRRQNRRGTSGRSSARIRHSARWRRLPTQRDIPCPLPMC